MIGDNLLADSLEVLGIMTNEPNISRLGGMLRTRRREKRLSLRDLAAEIGVALNTLSRIERGHVPDLKNFQRVVDWLEVPANSFLDAEVDRTPTPEMIARHLRSDRRLSADAAAKIAEIVEDMYRQLVGDRRPLAVHLRSAKTFTPAAGALLSEILHEMQAELDKPGDD